MYNKSYVRCRCGIDSVTLNNSQSRAVCYLSLNCYNLVLIITSFIPKQCRSKNNDKITKIFFIVFKLSFLSFFFLYLHMWLLWPFHPHKDACHFRLVKLITFKYLLHSVQHGYPRRLCILDNLNLTFSFELHLH